MAEQQLVISRSGDSDTSVVTVSGEIDIATLSEFADALSGAVAAGSREVRVDLALVSYFGSEAVRGLVQARAAAQARGVVLTVRHPSVIARKVLEITDLDDLIIDDGA